MKTHWSRFNTYLALVLAATVICGCRTSGDGKSKKLLSILRLHLEASRDATGSNRMVPVYREHPFMVNVETVPFLAEPNVVEAKVVDVVGGYALSVRFDDAGKAILEQCTVSNRGRKIAVFCQFGEELKDSRWLAAPVISKHISDGILIFTPDATREETEEIARGLTNVAKKTQKWVDR